MRATQTDELGWEMKPAIAILAFNRPLALKRLLDSIRAAEYPESTILVISLEYGAAPAVVDMARSFRCDRLNVRVISQDNKLGLRRHVLACGELVEEYGSIIVLEDDLIIDRYFYTYAMSALLFYDDDEGVAGISLYSYEYNEFAGLPFKPMANGFDTYPMQIPCSWGQCWSRKQWRQFKSWYSGKTQSDLDSIDRLPMSVKTWPESSWKKYFHGYMIESGTYFVYPYMSFSTNCSDNGGTHIMGESFSYQVSLALQDRHFSPLRFAPTNFRDVVYDSFMEPVGDFLFRTIGYSSSEVEIDLQGIKPMPLLKKKKYALTTRNGAIEKIGYPQRYRPVEVNLLFPSKRDDANITWRLLDTNHLVAGVCRYHKLTWYSYYAGMPIRNKNVYISIILDLPVAFIRKLLSRLFGSNT